MWLILNDAIVGYAVGAFLSENQGWIGEQLINLTKVSRRWLYTRIAHVAKHWTIHHIRAILTWLDNWPIGLKLNTQLSQFICVCSISVIDIWLRKPTLIHTLSLSHLTGVI